MRKFILTIAALVSLGAALSGCGSGKQSASGTTASSHIHTKASANGLSPGMVAAVAPPGAGAGTVQVKFELQGHPDVATPVDVDIVILPMLGNVDRIVGKFTASDGLEVVSGEDLPPADKPVEGTAINHTVRVLPKREGIFTLTAALTVDVGGRSASEIYSMPVIAGAGSPDAPTQAGSAAGGDAGAAHPAAAVQ